MVAVTCSAFWELDEFAKRPYLPFHRLDAVQAEDVRPFRDAQALIYILNSTRGDPTKERKLGACRHGPSRYDISAHDPRQNHRTFLYEFA